jgi:hypothetical protein
MIRQQYPAGYVTKPSDADLPAEMSLKP